MPPSIPIPPPSRPPTTTGSIHVPPATPPQRSVLRPPAVVPAELGELVDRDSALVEELGWREFVRRRRPRSDIGSLHVPHPGNRILNHYKHHGVPVRFSSPAWTKAQLLDAISRGAHRSCNEHLAFLKEEFVDMVNKRQWVVLPFDIAQHLPGLRLSPPGVVEQRDRRPRWICDYTWYGVNDDTLRLVPLEAMQFGHTLERFLRELLLADPAQGPIFMMKLDISDGFYRIAVAPDDIPKLGVVFPSDDGQALVALPLVLPMGWCNSPPAFSAATETAADIANDAIAQGEMPPPHSLASLAAEQDDPSPGYPPSSDGGADISTLCPAKTSLRSDCGADTSTLCPAKTSLRSDCGADTATLCPAMTSSRSVCELPESQPDGGADTSTLCPTGRPQLQDGCGPSRGNGTAQVAKERDGEPPFVGVPTEVSHPQDPIAVPTTRDPCLPTSQPCAAYVDVFVDDFVALAQSLTTRQRVRRVLFHAVDSVFRPNDFYDDIHRREPNSIKKLRKGDCSWAQVKTILGWVINTMTMTISLPEHRVERLAEILASIPLTQKRTSVRKWHKVLGELRSMSLALPGARHLFSQMQHALSTATKTRIALKKGVHQALQDFRWLYDNIRNRPTRIAELIPLLPSALGYHDASGTGAGGVWFPTKDLVPRAGVAPGQPLLWRFQWPEDIVNSLVSTSNPDGTITNSDLELAGGLLHLDALAQSYDIRERTIVSKTDNLPTMFWERKGSCTGNSPPAYLLRLFGMHQRFHRYVPRHDYIPGLSNPMADDASRLFHLSSSEFLQHFATHHPQTPFYKLVTPPAQLTSAVILALRRKTSAVESLLVVPPPPLDTGPSGSSTQISWASTPFSKPSRTKYPSFKSSSTAFDPADITPSNVKSSLDRLKSTYGRLPRRTSPWGPQTHARM